MTWRRFGDLIGKKIVGHAIATDRLSMTLTFQDSSVTKLVVTGDCCSKSWIESVDCPDNLHGTVFDVEEIEMPNLGNVGTVHHGSVDEVKYYGLKIVTDRGHCVIDYRNDSNGYYGGGIAIQ